MFMRTPVISAFRRGTKLVLKVELDEDDYAHAPFLRRIPEPQPFARRFELCFHRGWPTEEARSGRRVKFEHVEEDLPDHVTTLRIQTAASETVEINRQPGALCQAGPRGKKGKR